MRIEDTPTVLWQLWRNDRRLTCSVRLAPAGLSLEQHVGGRRLVTQTFRTAEALYAHARRVRQSCVEEGWSEKG